jgi:inorganic triphosphatase YgiF
MVLTKEGAMDDIPQQTERIERCDHICLKDADHVERGEPHFYGYEHPSPRAENTRLRAEKEAAESTGWHREDQLLSRIQVLEAANYQLQAEVARLRSALSEINQVPHRSATPLKRMRIMWDLATAALSNEGGGDGRVVNELSERRGWDTPSRPRDDRGVDRMPRTLWETS